MTNAVSLHRPARLTMVVLGLAAYLGLCATLFERGLVMGSAAALWQFMGVWAAGFCGLLVIGDRGASLTFARAVWCNVGVVTVALLVPHALRFLMLVPAMFGVMYCALTLRRDQLMLASAVTFGVYLVVDLLLMSFGEPDIGFEVAALAGFAAMLIGVNFLADEVFALRDAFEARRERLDTALERLSQLAVRDELTGVYNRRHIGEVLERHKALADRRQLDFTVCFCDLDKFKQVNDGFGHGRGDEVLRHFAALALETVRAVDFVARLGGDEFLLVLIGADERVAEQVMNRLRVRTGALGVGQGGHPWGGISVSIGVAKFRPDEQVAQLLARADEALYEAKSLGRNRVVVAGEVVGEVAGEVAGSLLREVAGSPPREAGDSGPPRELGSVIG